MCQVVIHRVAPHTDITFIPINIFFFFFFSIRRSLRETPLISLFVSNQVPRRLGLSRFFYPSSPLNSSRPSRQCQVLSVSFASSISRHETYGYASSKLSRRNNSGVNFYANRVEIGSAWHRIHHLVYTGIVTKLPRSIYSLERWWTRFRKKPN